MENRKTLLSLRGVELKFKVRGRFLTAIRGVDLDIYDGETIAIVGESGSGKSVLTKTFSGMNDSNGFISAGDIFLNDDELSDTHAKVNNKFLLFIHKQLNKYSHFENGATLYQKISDLKKERLFKINLQEEEKEPILKQIQVKNNQIVEKQNEIMLYDKSKDKEIIVNLKKEIAILKKEIKTLDKSIIILAKNKKAAYKKDVEFQKYYSSTLKSLKAELKEAYKKEVNNACITRNEIFAKEILLSTSRYSFSQQFTYAFKILRQFKKSMIRGVDLSNKDNVHEIFNTCCFHVEYLETLEDGSLHGKAIINLAKVDNPRDWQKIRGTRIATVFQDPMTSLNPIITIGKQITNVIIKHQHVSLGVAKEKAIEIMRDVGITNPEKRFDDYPFQYSGGMRQRIVIAIALSCRPKILICDEPTTALDVTIQAQILKLIKKLQNEYKFTTVYITHDLGVVANVAERVAVLYAGQVIEYGLVEEIFYDPKHPYTWALLSSLPQLSVIGEKLYSIEGTPPSLYNKIVGDAFAPRNPYCMKVDLVKEPPMFKISETHFAKTWLCDPRAPKVEKPKNIQNLHETLVNSVYNQKN